MDQLTSWVSRRSGAAMTVTGNTPTGSRRVLTGVGVIKVDAQGRVIAVLQDGSVVQLVTAADAGAKSPAGA